MGIKLPLAIDHPLVRVASRQEHQVVRPASVLLQCGVLGSPSCGVAHELHVLGKLVFRGHEHRLHGAFALAEDRHVKGSFSGLDGDVSQAAFRRRRQGRAPVVHLEVKVGTWLRVVHHGAHVLSWHEPILKQEGGFRGPRADRHGGPPSRFRWGGFWGTTPERNKGHGASHSLWNEVLCCHVQVIRNPATECWSRSTARPMGWCPGRTRTLPWWGKPPWSRCPNPRASMPRRTLREAR